MRFQDGEINRARDMCWNRPVPSQQGCVMPFTSGERYVVPTYRECSVFSCGPHLPVVASNLDVSVFTTEEHDWHAPKFLSLNHARGVSVAVLDPEVEVNSEMVGSDPVKQVIGKNARWVPSLVPNSYKTSSSSSAPTSRGLTGNLNLLLGLMAMSMDPAAATPSNIQQVFSGSHRRFSNYDWSSSGNFSGRKWPMLHS